MTTQVPAAELTELRAVIQTVAEAVSTLTSALERLPTEQADEAERRLNRGVRRAHELLLTLPSSSSPEAE